MVYPNGIPYIQDDIIERYDNDWLTNSWKSVDFGNRYGEVSGWTHPIVSKLNEEEILVMGGIQYYRVGRRYAHKFETSGDIWIFNVKRDELQR